MDFFSIDRDRVTLPRGAWAQSYRTNIAWKGRSLTALSQGPFRAYLFPVYTPAGFAVTSECPVDHPHHNSLWIGADHFNCYFSGPGDALEEATYNFYVNETFQGRAPGRIVSTALETLEMAEDHLHIVQSLNWQGPAEWGAPPGGRTLAQETRIIDLYPRAQANIFDLRSQLRPTEWDICIGPTRHAYFGVRLAEALRVTSGAQLVDALGRSGGEAISGQVSDWVDCSGTIAAGRKAGVALIPHPSAAGAPWFVTDWGTLTVNPLLRQPRILRQGDRIDLAVRVVVHDGDAEEAGIAEQYEQAKEEFAA